MGAEPDESRPRRCRNSRIGAPNGDRTRVSAVKETLKRFYRFRLVFSSAEISIISLAYVCACSY
jgi:hypothetical protein